MRLCDDELRLISLVAEASKEATASALLRYLVFIESVLGPLMLE